jgi:hypothetical protein
MQRYTDVRDHLRRLGSEDYACTGSTLSVARVIGNDAACLYELQENLRQDLALLRSPAIPKEHKSEVESLENIVVAVLAEAAATLQCVRDCLSARLRRDRQMAQASFNAPVAAAKREMTQPHGRRRYTLPRLRLSKTDEAPDGLLVRTLGKQ